MISNDFKFSKFTNRFFYQYLIYFNQAWLVSLEEDRSDINSFLIKTNQFNPLYYIQKSRFSKTYKFKKNKKK